MSARELPFEGCGQRPFFDLHGSGYVLPSIARANAAGLAAFEEDELIVDNFAGGGGASEGLEQAFGRPVDIAINHDPEALAMHALNHPHTVHLCESVWTVRPLKVTQGRPVGLLWLSPDCKHFSKAKGGTPVAKHIRGLAWVGMRWVALTKPRVFILENVEEFQTWGPLLVDAEGNARPDPSKKGKTFESFVRQLRAHGYVVDWRELRACDYGTPTIRKRLFLLARRDGQPIVWPEATHGAPDSLGVKAKKLKPWRTAAECIDWSVTAPSIFERTRPLADATCRRIAKGIVRYVIDAAEPYIVRIGQQGGNGAYSNSIHQPVTTITTKAEHLLAVPTLIQTGYGERSGQAPRVPGLDKPMGTLVGGQKHALVSAFLAKHYTGVVGSDLADPVSTVTSVDHHSLVAASLVHMGHGEGKDGTKRFSHGIRDIEQPLNTVAASGMPAGVVTSHMLKLRGDNVGSGTDEPVHTISAQGTHHAEVRAFLIKYYGTDQDPALLEPLHTVTTKDRFGLVMVKGEPYAIVDIGLRMLTPRELYRAQGFRETYQIDEIPDPDRLFVDGKQVLTPLEAPRIPLTKTAQVRMVGNSVCPPLAKALAAANFPAVPACVALAA